MSPQVPESSIDRGGERVAALEAEVDRLQKMLDLIPNEIIGLASAVADLDPMPDRWKVSIHPNGWVDVRLGDLNIAGVSHAPNHREHERWWVNADDGYSSSLRKTTPTLQAAVDWIRETWLPQRLAQARSTAS